MFKSRCYNGGLKHNFQPRYSYEEGSPAITETILVDVIEASKSSKKTYHYDICKWCGKIAIKPEESK